MRYQILKVHSSVLLKLEAAKIDVFNEQWTIKNELWEYYDYNAVANFYVKDKMKIFSLYPVENTTEKNCIAACHCVVYFLFLFHFLYDLFYIVFDCILFLYDKWEDKREAAFHWVQAQHSRDKTTTSKTAQTIYNKTERVSEATNAAVTTCHHRSSCMMIDDDVDGCVV